MGRHVAYIRALTGGPGMMAEPGTQHILVLCNGREDLVSIAEADELCRKHLAVPIPKDFPQLSM